MKSKILKKIFSLIILAVILLHFSCNKDDNKTLTVSGRITDANQQIAVADAEVSFWASRLQNGTYNPNLTNLLTVNTDANGNYSFTVTKEKDALYRITVSKSKYFGLSNDINVDDLAAGSHILNYSILPEAFIKLHVKNVNFYDNSDFIGYSFASQQPVGINCCNNQPTIGLGFAYENTLFCKTFGAQKIKIEWTVKKNQINSVHDTMIYCVPFDTTKFDLIY